MFSWAGPFRIEQEEIKPLLIIKTSVSSKEDRDQSPCLEKVFEEMYEFETRAFFQPCHEGKKILNIRYLVIMLADCCFLLFC